MFAVILLAALPFHLLMEIAERMNKRDAMDAARARKVAEHLVASRDKHCKPGQTEDSTEGSDQGRCHGGNSYCRGYGRKAEEQALKFR